MKKTNRSDLRMMVSMIATVITFWIQIVCAFVGDRNFVAPWCFFIYMISTLAILWEAMGSDTKWAAVKIIGGSIIMWSILLILYTGILALRGFL